MVIGLLSTHCMQVQYQVVFGEDLVVPTLTYYKEEILFDSSQCVRYQWAVNDLFWIQVQINLIQITEKRYLKNEQGFF